MTPNNKIEFPFNPTELENLAQTIAALNAAGIPWSIRRDAVAIELTISTGY